MGRKRNILSEYVNMPRVTINDKVYVDKEILIAYALDLLACEVKYSENEDEKLGIEMAMQIIENLLQWRTS